MARYGAHPVVWITCQEMNAPDEMGGKESNRMSAWQSVARAMADCDGYGHPHSAHQWVLDVATRPLCHEPWHDWFALQGGHRNSGLTPQVRYKGYYDSAPTRPMLETEAMYERVDCGGVNTTGEARQSAWKALLCGSPGYTYGAAGIWALKWDANDPRWKEYNHAVGSWHEGMSFPGAAQMIMLKQFFSAMNWTELTPRFQDPAWSEWSDGERSVLATIGNQLYVAYCYGATSEGTLKQLDVSGAYVARWFDPRKGDMLEARRISVRQPAHGMFRRNLPLKTGFCVWKNGWILNRGRGAPPEFRLPKRVAGSEKLPRPYPRTFGSACRARNVPVSQMLPAALTPAG